MSEILFLTAGTIDIASSRYRSFWPANYLDSAEVHPLGYALKVGIPIKSDTKTVVFQKFASIPMMKYAKDHGLKVVWDVCDPSWWFAPDKVKDILDQTDIVTASTKGLLLDLSEHYPEHRIDKIGRVIPDAFDPEHYINAKGKDYEEGKLDLIWFGHHNNRYTLLAHLAELERLAITGGIEVSLTILDGEPENRWGSNRINIRHEKWALESEVEIISSHDIAFLPSHPGRWGRLKSNNKQVHAGYCGLNTYNPNLASDYEYTLEKLLNSRVNTDWLKGYSAVKVAERWTEVLG